MVILMKTIMNVTSGHCEYSTLDPKEYAYAAVATY